MGSDVVVVGVAVVIVFPSTDSTGVLLVTDIDLMGGLGAEGVVAVAAVVAVAVAAGVGLSPGVPGGATLGTLATLGGGASLGAGINSCSSLGMEAIFVRNNFSSVCAITTMSSPALL